MVMSLADRYSWPVICTEWTPGDASAVEETLKLFAAHQVRWYSTGTKRTMGDLAGEARKPAEIASRLRTQGLLDPQVLADKPNLSRLVKHYQFQRVITPRQ
jgi:hypothetical protein